MITKLKRSIIILLAVLVTGGALYALWGRQQLSPAEAEENISSANQERRIPVVLGTAEIRPFESSLHVQGNLEAKNTAVVSARIPGTLESVLVDEGDVVEKGKTALFKVDALKVQKALEAAKQDLAAAELAHKEKEAYLERIEADFEKARIDYKRYQKLYEDFVVPVDVLETQRSRYKQSKAMVKHAKTLVDLTEEQKQQAALAVDVAQKDRSDAVVYAPLSGFVTARLREAGEMVGVGNPVIKIEDPAVVEVSAFLPAEYYARVKEGKTRVRLKVYGIDAGVSTVSYKSPAIHPKLRSFEIKCVLDNPPDGVVPGAMAEMVVVLDKTDSLGVPAEALQFRNNQDVVFVVEGERAAMVAVERGLESDGWVAVESDALKPGMPVIVMGQYLIEHDSAIVIQGEDN